jgi:MerR family transcriptional regulator, copper efflux regulator
MAQTPVAGDEELVPIDEVARRFGMQASALRYYERRGLLQPAARHAGRRWYGRAELRQLAIIGFWQQSGLMSLDDISAVLAGPEHSRSWKQIVSERREALDAQIGQMTVARDYLEHLLTCPREHSLDGCPYFEEAIWQPPGQRLEAAKCHAEHHQKPSPGGSLSRPVPGAPSGGER